MAKRVECSRGAREMQRPTPKKRRISAVAAAMAGQTQTTGEGERIAAILAEARTRIRGQMTPAQIEDPSDDDINLGTEKPMDWIFPW